MKLISLRYIVSGLSIPNPIYEKECNERVQL